MLKGYEEYTHFNPQGSHEPRRQAPSSAYKKAVISIHKALTSLDRLEKRLRQLQGNFNPQGSHEPRRSSWHTYRLGVRFQSTRLSRASTWQKIKDVFKLDISIHKALTSLDSLKHLDQLQLQEFQSTRRSRAPSFGIC